MSNETLQTIIYPSITDASPLTEKTSYNVLDFGAVGDGIIDDSKAFQSAIDTGSIVIPASDSSYRIVTGIDIPANRTIHANGNATILVDPSSTYIGAFRCTGSNILIKGINFEGNGILTSCSGSHGSDTGAAIRGNAVSDIKITNCRFDLFICSGLNGDIIGFSDTRNITVSNNNFLNTNQNGGADISISYRTGSCIITNNYSTSNSDLFCGLCSVGSSDNIDAASDISKTSHHIISNNIYLKNGGKGNTCNGRHGILVHYAGGISHCVITNNILANGKRHGIYLRGDNTVGGYTGPDIVKNNIIRYFGGEEPTDNYWGYNSGIKVEVMGGAIIDGNLIEYSGYWPDGTMRTYKSAGIDIVRALKNVKIINNNIKNCAGGGIMILPTVLATASTYNVENLDIIGNYVSNNGDIQLNINNRASSGIKYTRITIKNNVFESNVSNTTITALDLGGGGVLCQFIVQKNKFVGSYNGGSGTNQIGLGIRNISTNILHIKNNTFENLYWGSGMRDANIPTASWPSTLYSVHREIGSRIRYLNNTFKDCYEAVIAQQLAAYRIAFVEPNNKFINCTISPRTRLYSPSPWNQVYYGRVIGLDSSNIPLIELIVDVATPIPTVEQYYQGDRVTYINPTASGNIGAVCVTSGTPGTWKTYGAVSA